MRAKFARAGLNVAVVVIAVLMSSGALNIGLSPPANAHPPDQYLVAREIRGSTGKVEMYGTVYFVTAADIHYFIVVKDLKKDGQCANFELRYRGYQYSDWIYQGHVCGGGTQAFFHHDDSIMTDFCCGFVEFSVEESDSGKRASVQAASG